MDILLTLDMTRSWFISIFRILFAFFDWIVYSVITLLFRAVFNLANFELYGMYEEILERVYVVLGIFMLFKVTISLITYLVNPDKISDKEAGISKLSVRVVTVLVMLIGLPTFFSFMTELQNTVLPVIPRIIIGTPNTLGSNDVTGISENMALTMVQGFADEKEECSGEPLQNVNDFLAHINDPCSADNNIYRFNYKPVFSTLTGIAMCYVLLSLCISVAVRAFKLIILRSIAPIPVISYIDPKSSKDGAFATWVRTFMTTWSELLINIGIIYFIVYIIGFMLTGNMWQGFFSNLDASVMGGIDGVFLFAFIVIGLFFFARQAPKFVMDALGIKSKGNFMRMLGMGATTVGAVGSVASGIKARREQDAANNVPSSARRTIGNMGASLFEGVKSLNAGGTALMNSDKPGLTTGIDQITKNNAQNLRRIEAGSTARGRAESRLHQLFGGRTYYEEKDELKKGWDSLNDAIGKYQGILEKKAVEDTKIHFDYTDKNNVTHQAINYVEFQANLEGARNGDAASIQWFEDRNWKQWQDAAVQSDEIKDMQINQRAANFKTAVEAHEQNPNNTDVYKFAEYTDYRATKEILDKVPIDHSTDLFHLANGDGSGIKEIRGESSRKSQDIAEDPRYKAGKADKAETK